MTLSLRAYARHRKARGLTGTTHGAVQAAIRAGRLATSLTTDGQIADAERADREWSEATHADRVPLTGPTAPGAAVRPRAPVELPEGVPPIAVSRAKREAIAVERAQHEFDRERGLFIRVDEARAAIAADYSIVRAHLLGIPSRMAQRLSPELRVQVCGLADELIREALEQLADGTPQALARAEHQHTEGT
ncbi:MAG TPA: hypothetical protein VHW23_12575 [Kofleriaceae bacterium]|jgi:hypothetical protein|nr:hypothetical protein [Kofleriaceae bacterium]